MTEFVPVRRLDSVSKNTAALIANVTAALDMQGTPQEADALSKGLVTGNFVKLAAAEASGCFAPLKHGLYKEADTEDGYGRIWLKKEFTNPDTGEKEFWLVAYTTDEDEIVHQVAAERKGMLKTAQPTPKAKDIPIAPGLKSKNLTIDETGGGGTAKVTLEFTDVDQGLKFYQEQQGVAEQKKEEKPAEGEEAAATGEEVGAEKKAPAAPAAPGMGAPPVPPAPGFGAAPAQGAIKSTISPFTKHGQKLVTIIRSTKENLKTLSYVNEGGKEWTLPEGFSARVGQQFERPDNGELARIGGYVEIAYSPLEELVGDLIVEALTKSGKNYYCNTCEAKFSDKQMNFHSGHNYREYGDDSEKKAAPKTAADVSDNVPPMSFKTDESGKAPAGAGPALPPSPALQQDQGPKPGVLYDSSQDKGPQFQTTIDPKQKSVTVKFLDSQAEDALEQALGQPQQQAPGAPMAPAAPAPGAQPGAPPPAPAGGPAPFDQQNIPTEF